MIRLGIMEHKCLSRKYSVLAAHGIQRSAGSLVTHDAKRMVVKIS